MKKSLKRYTLPLSLAFGMLLALAQEGRAQQVPKIRVPQQLYWTRYYNQFEFSPRWELHTELDSRRFFSPHVQHQALLRSHLHYKFSNGWDVGAGFVRFFQFPQDPLATNRQMVPEWRFFVDVQQRTNIGKLQIRQRHRLEDRNFQVVQNGALTSSYRTNYRFRYQLQAEYPLIRRQGQNRGNLTLRVSDEIMFNFGRQITYNYFDQNRIYAALSYQLLENLATEVGYLHWFQQQPVGNVYFDRDILRLTVYHKMGRRKEEIK
jgi:hypothetical protein